MHQVFFSALIIVLFFSSDNPFWNTFVPIVLLICERIWNFGINKGILIALQFFQAAILGLIIEFAFIIFILLFIVGYCNLEHGTTVCFKLNAIFLPAVGLFAVFILLLVIRMRKNKRVYKKLETIENQSLAS